MYKLLILFIITIFVHLYGMDIPDNSHIAITLKKPEQKIFPSYSEFAKKDGVCTKTLVNGSLLSAGICLFIAPFLDNQLSPALKMSATICGSCIVASCVTKVAYDYFPYAILHKKYKEFSAIIIGQQHEEKEENL